MLIGWFLLGLFIGSGAIAHMREYIEIHEDFLEANRELQEAKRSLFEDSALVCPKCFKGMGVEEVAILIKKLSKMSSK